MYKQLLASAFIFAAFGVWILVTPPFGIFDISLGTTTLILAVACANQAAIDKTKQN